MARGRGRGDDPQRPLERAHRGWAVRRYPQARRLRRAARERGAWHRQHGSAELPRAAAPLRVDPARGEPGGGRELRALLRRARRSAARRGWRHARPRAPPCRVRQGAARLERARRRDLALRPRALRRVSLTRRRISEHRVGCRHLERPGVVRAGLNREVDNHVALSVTSREGIAMKHIRWAGLALALTGIVASACGGTTTPAPGGGGTTTPAAAGGGAAVTQELIIGFSASQTGP